MKVVKVAYFSGTGGAKLIAEHAAMQLEEEGCVVDREGIGRGLLHEDAFEIYDLVLLVSVVHEFNFPYPVRSWVSSLSCQNYSQAAVFSVSGGGAAIGNRGAQREVIGTFERQGIPVITDEIFVMPSNFFYRIKHPVDVMLMDAYPVMVAQSIERILNGKLCRPKTPLLDRLVTRFFKNSWKHTNAFGRAITVTQDCTACGICVKTCPVDNIVMNSESAHPSFGENCVFCLGCLYACPASALNPGKDRYALLKEGYDLEEIKQRSYDDSDWDTIEILCRGYLYSGVKKYLLEARTLL